MEIKEIKVEWNEKMKVLAEQGYTQKDMDNLNIERQKLDDLAFLKAQQTSGPFTDPESVQYFMKNEPDCKEKMKNCIVKSDFNGIQARHLKKMLQCSA